MIMPPPSPVPETKHRKRPEPRPAPKRYSARQDAFESTSSVTLHAQRIRQRFFAEGIQ